MGESHIGLQLGGMQKLLIGEQVYLQVSDLFLASGNRGAAGGPGGGEVRLGFGEASLELGTHTHLG